MVDVFLKSGSHFLTKADWGCHDGVHKAWMVVDVDQQGRGRAASCLPALRAQATIVQLNCFTRSAGDRGHSSPACVLRSAGRDLEGGVEGVRADADPHGRSASRCERSVRGGAVRRRRAGAEPSGGPAALEHGRLFMSAATPAKLFRVLLAGDPASRARGGGFELARPRRGGGRSWALLLALVLSDVITFAYHYPRNHLLFDSPLTVEPERLHRRRAATWAAANLVRVALVLGSWIATLTALLGKASAWPNL